MWGDASEAASLLGIKAVSGYSWMLQNDLRITGSENADKLVADARFASYVDAKGGDDLLTSSIGRAATLAGGRGDDIYSLKNATDKVIELAGDGTDTVIAEFNYALTDNVENLRLAVGGLTGTGNILDNRIVGSSGADVILGLGGNDMLQGLQGNDRVDGGDVADTIRGDEGDDTLLGGNGNDSLLGGSGNDTLTGGTGNDLLEGGAGFDRLEGNAGSDTFRWRPGDLDGGAIDTILDFNARQDVIDLSMLDANSRTAGNEAFRFIGSNAFRGVAGELRVETSGGMTKILGDVNGDRIADFTLEIVGLHDFTNGSLVL
jgi:Ca2+-binding RTX toxin-like protein